MRLALFAVLLINHCICNHNVVNTGANCSKYSLGYQCITRNTFLWCSPTLTGSTNYTFECPTGTSCDYLFSTTLPHVTHASSTYFYSCVGIPVQPRQTSLSQGYSCDPIACKLPKCKCPSNESPRDVSETPQLVMLTFDGRITPTTLEPVKELLFDRPFNNPNGCNIRSTWFAPFLGSNADQVAEYLRNGHELAVRTFNDTINPEPRDISEARRLFSSLFEGFNETEIRTPDLKFTYSTFPYLKSLGFLYDASIPEQSFSPFSPLPSKKVRHLTAFLTCKVWPYTLDYGIATNCFIGTCNLDYQANSSRQPGLWSIPMYTMDNVDNTSSSFGIAQSVFGPNGNNAEVRSLWVDNFLAHYHGNRAPFGLWLTPAWLIESPDRIPLLQQFLGDILGLGDVWIISGTDLISYMRNPMTTKEIEETKGTPFTCPAIQNITKRQNPATSVVEEKRIPWPITPEGTIPTNHPAGPGGNTSTGNLLVSSVKVFVLLAVGLLTM